MRTASAVFRIPAWLARTWTHPDANLYDKLTGLAMAIATGEVRLVSCCVPEQTPVTVEAELDEWEGEHGG